MVPGYYGVAAPWGIYAAGLIGAAGQVQGQRRPLTPTGNELNGTAPGQYQMIPAFYDQNGGFVMGARGANPLTRLISPAPVLVNNPGIVINRIELHTPYFILFFLFSILYDYPLSSPSFVSLSNVY